MNCKTEIGNFEPTPKIKECQKNLLDIFLKFDEWMKLNDFQYFLFAGTLLGAVRHKGFIPWDDDIDVCMIREEYERLLDFVKENPQSFNDFCGMDDVKFLYYPTINSFPWLKLVKTPTFQIVIDTFPLDKTPQGLKRKFKSLYINIWTYVYGRKYRRDSGLFEGNFIRNTIAFLLQIGKTEEQIWGKTEKCRRMFQNDRSAIWYEDFCSAKEPNPDGRSRFRDYGIKNPVTVEFEGYQFYASSDYIESLVRLFGQDWEIPVKKNAHNESLFE